ncbi:hypothetical protein [Enterobacter hormaechei]|uniref:hypothetical protein n=1 Tax=Enterobacter hormaechei TaxID=158836 RepID=UPI000AE79B8E|nr:hypothetical protein [Enterobacter hormaechei]
MSTLTKEWLLKTIAELEEERDATPGAVNEDAAMALAAMKIALASLEAEAVAWIVHARTGDQLTTDGGYVANAEGILGLHSTPLYTAPPAPMLPEEMPKGLAGQIVSLLAHNVGDKLLAKKIWNACRAAMLQGAEQTNYRAIVERIAEIIHGKVTDIDLLTVTVKSMKDKLQK